MVCCALRACSSRNVVESKKQSGTTYHRFPRDLERRKKWLQFVSRSDWEPSKYSVLCSKHFEEQYIDRSSLCCVRLRDNAVPTIYIPSVTDNESDKTVVTIEIIPGSTIESTKFDKHCDDSSEIIINVLQNQFACNVCLQGAQKLVNVCQIPQDNVQWLVKLNTCIPEVNWDESFMICEVCSQRLDEVFNFRNLCISSNLYNLCTHREFNLNNTGCTLCKVTGSNLQISHIEEFFISPEEPVLKKTKQSRIGDVHCDNCEMVFSSGVKLVNHCVAKHGYNASDARPFQKRHLNKTQYTCENCSKLFNSEQTLRKHVLIEHTNPNEYICPYCDKRCASKLNHIQHIRTHSRRKRFACHLCSKRFEGKIALQKHVAIHWNIKPFKCQHCNMKYKSENAFHVHLKKVHDIGDNKLRKKVN